MAFELKDRIYTECTTVGTGDAVIGEPKIGYQGWDAITPDSTVYYCIADDANWEVGYGEYSNEAGTQKITRNLLSSSTGSLLELSGDESIFCTYPAEKSVYLDIDGNVKLPNAEITANKFIGDGSELTNLPIPELPDVYTKTQTDTLLDAKANVGDSYLKSETYNTTEIDGKLYQKADKDNTYTKDEVDNLIEGSSGAIVGNYTNKWASSVPRDPSAGNLYLVNVVSFTTNYNDVTTIYISDTDGDGDVRDFDEVKADDKVTLTSDNGSGEYTIVTITDVGGYRELIVNKETATGTIADNTPVSIVLDVASSGGGDGIPEAPIDGKQYARQDEAWSEVEATGGGTVADGCIYLNNQTVLSDYTIPTGKNGMSAGAIDFVGTVTVPDGSKYHVVDSTPTGGVSGENLIINGDMRIAQRATSVTGKTVGGYLTMDRWQTTITTIGTWSQSQSTDTPSGQGFANSLKMDCTTADASLAAGDHLLVNQKFEGLNLQNLAKGTSEAKSVTVSFWVKSSKTGTYILEVDDRDNTRGISQSYTIDSANTWEKKSLTFAGDTTGAFDNDNQASLFLTWWLGVGTDFSSGTLATSWAARTNTNRAVGQVNLADSTDNYINITGVQLEVGDTATPFQHLKYGQQLALCQRYFQKITFGCATAKVTNSTNAPMSLNFNTTRATPTISVTYQHGNKVGSGPAVFSNSMVSAYGPDQNSIIWETSGDATNNGAYTTRWIATITSEL